MRCGLLLLHLHGLEGLVLYAVAVMSLHTILVLDDLPIQLVDQEVDGRIKIFMVLLDEDVFTLEVQVDFRVLATVLLLVVIDR